MARETIRGAFNIDHGCGTKIIIGKIIESIKDTYLYLFQHLGDLNGLTPMTKVAAPLVARPGRIKRAIYTQNLKGNHLKLMKDINQHMKDFIIEGFADSVSKNRKGALTRDIPQTDTGIRSISPALIIILENRKKIGHILVPAKVSEYIKEKKAHRIIRRRAIGRIS